MEVIASPISEEARRNNRRSLLIPSEPVTIGILDTSSYSPFPTFPGSSHARDPFGLNAYLLHPEDTLWSYVDPAPIPSASTSSLPPPDGQVEHGGEHVMGVERGRNLGRVPSLRKQKSLSAFGRPSPLSQPPLVAGESGDSVPRIRKRSKSQDSNDRYPVNEEIAVSLQAKSSFSLGRKSFRKVLQLNKVSSERAVLPTAVPTITTPSSASSTPPKPTTPLDEDPTTPMTCRSTSNLSARSGSSTDSSDGIRTPLDGVQLDVTLASAKLVDALQDEAKKTSSKWRWFGKKGSKLFKSPGSSGTSTPTEDGPITPTSVGSTMDLTRIATPSLTPSPSFVAPIQKIITRTPQQVWTGDQLRRMSHNKLHQLRNPSPHPLALTLRRQHLNLPDEITLSLQEGKMVFPSSVNSFQPSIYGLSPDQSYLRISTSIKGILKTLEKGIVPSTLETFSRRRHDQPRRGSVKPPNGISDFVKRPPFEDRMVVFYPGEEGCGYEVGMARKGYAIWDIDFSSYILALAEVCERSVSPVGPRSMSLVGGPSYDVAEEVISVKVEEVEDLLECLDSPILESEPLGKVTKTNCQTDISPKAVVPVSLGPSTGESSFNRMASAKPQTWDYSDDDEEDDEPLSQLQKRTVSPLPQTLTSPSNSSHIPTVPPPKAYTRTPKPPAPTPTTHTRTLSQPGPSASRRPTPTPEQLESRKRIEQSRAIEAVVSARTRRNQLISGEIERLAEADVIRAKLESKGRSVTKRSSAYSLDSQTTRPRSGVVREIHKRPSSSVIEIQQAQLISRERISGPRRAQSQYGLDSIAVPTTARPKDGRRYHSFYESAAQSTSSLSLPSSSSSSSLSNQPLIPYVGAYQYPHTQGLVHPASRYIHQMQPQIYQPVYQGGGRGRMYGSMIDLSSYSSFNDNLTERNGPVGRRQSGMSFHA